MKFLQTRTLLIVSVIFALAITVSILGVDHALARAVDELPIKSGLLKITSVLETAFGFGVSKFLIGFALLVIAGMTFLANRVRASRWTYIALFIGLTHLASRLTVGMTKNVFGRLRPFQWLEHGPPEWFVHGGSFPSGHTVHFFALFLPLAILLPRRWTFVVMVLPVFVGVSRVLVNDHFLSDVLASIYIAYVFAYGLARLLNVERYT